MLYILAIVVVLLGVACSARAYTIFPRRKPPLPNSSPSEIERRTEPCSLAVFLGSGGHTSEMLALVSALDFERYTPRTYVVSEGDTLSAQKAVALEAAQGYTQSTSTSPITKGAPLNAPYRILVVPRARHVHQPLLTTPPTALRALLTALYHLTALPLLTGTGPFSEVLLLNGPGTCFTLSIAAFISRFLGIPAPKLIYVESFARVKRLSLSGKLLRPFVDRFIVQWPGLLSDGGRGECQGWLV